jgi:hypothetical protein
MEAAALEQDVPALGNLDALDKSAGAENES